MDEQAFALLIEPHRRALHLHCYRMLGSMHDADDALQETMLRAWKGSDRYEPRAQLATWLHTIATNVCLTAIARRRARPVEAIEDLADLDAGRAGTCPRETVHGRVGRGRHRWARGAAARGRRDDDASRTNAGRRRVGDRPVLRLGASERATRRNPPVDDRGEPATSAR